MSLTIYFFLIIWFLARLLQLQMAKSIRNMNQGKGSSSLFYVIRNRWPNISFLAYRKRYVVNPLYSSTAYPKRKYVDNWGLSLCPTSPPASLIPNCFEHFRPPNYSYFRSFLNSFTYSSFDAVNQVSNISPCFVGILSVFPAISFWLRDPLCSRELSIVVVLAAVFSEIAFRWPARWQEEREKPFWTHLWNSPHTMGEMQLYSPIRKYIHLSFTQVELNKRQWNWAQQNVTVTFVFDS